MRVRTVASEAVLGLRRNLVMSVAAVVTVAVSLAFVGTALLVNRTVGEIREIFYTQIEISIFLNEEVTHAAARRDRTTLDTLPLVQSVDLREQGRGVPALQAAVPGPAGPAGQRHAGRAAGVLPGQAQGPDAVRGGRRARCRACRGSGQVVDYREFLDDLFADPRRAAQRRDRHGGGAARRRDAADRQHRAGRGVLPTPRDRGDAPGRRDPALHPAAVPARGGGRRPGRRRPRGRAAVRRQDAGSSTGTLRPLFRSGVIPSVTDARHLASPGSSCCSASHQRARLAGHPAALHPGLTPP